MPTEIKALISFLALIMLACVVLTVAMSNDLDRCLAEQALPSIEPDKVIFMQGCMADDNKEYQCILMWREHDGY